MPTAPSVDYILPEPAPGQNWPAPGETFIREYRNVVSKEVCQKAYDLFMSSPHKFEGMVGNNYISGNVDKEQKSSLDLDLCTVAAKNSEWVPLAHAFKAALGITGPKYAADIAPLYYVCSEAGIQNTGFQLQYYLNNGQDGFRPHIDRNTLGSSNRELSVLIYLNTVDEGGETAFPIQNVKVKPEMGKVVWFPAGFTHPHEGRTPISNPKLIVSTFMIYSEDPNVTRPGEINHSRQLPNQP